MAATSQQPPTGVDAPPPPPAPPADPTPAAADVPEVKDVGPPPADTPLEDTPPSPPPPALSTSPSSPGYFPNPDRPVRASVYVTRRIPQMGVETLLKQCDVRQWDCEGSVPRGEFLHSVSGVNAILCMASDNIDVQVLDAAGPNLQVIATVSSETGHIDKVECDRRGIQVIHCPSQSTDHYAELTVALVLLTLKEIQTDSERIANFEPAPPDLISTSRDSITSSWVHNRPRFMRRLSEERLAFQWSNGKPSNTNCPTWRNIASKTFGVYGHTKVGVTVAHILKNLGVERLLLSDCSDAATLDNALFVQDKEENSVDFVTVPFGQLLEEADVICVCGSASNGSEGVFNREAFRKMSPGAILVTSHSAEDSIDYVALYEALRDRHIKAAGLNDVNQEPVPFKEPLVGLRNCIFLPQTQESVYDTRHKVSVLMAKNLTQALGKGKALKPISE